jgi:hypothetical protein
VNDAATLEAGIVSHTPVPAVPNIVDVAIVVPVNAESDLDEARQLLEDLTAYHGAHTLDLVFVVNNFSPSRAPDGLAALEQGGARVLAVPNLRKEGYSIGIAARAYGLRHTRADQAILLDADCRVPNPTELVDWYVDQLRGGASAAYTRVSHHGLSAARSVRVRVWMHHTARWLKRTLLRIPTLRGSNYAVRTAEFLRLFDEGRIRHDINVGPAMKSAGGRIAYTGRRELTVLTSGRFLRPGWGRLLRYLPKRIGYNVRLMRRRH